MKNIILISLLLLAFSGCATRTKVYFNKKTNDRWINVSNPNEFLTKEELDFIN